MKPDEIINAVIAVAILIHVYKYLGKIADKGR